MRTRFLTLIVTLAASIAFCADIVIYPTIVVKQHGTSITGCVGGYEGYANYTKPIASGWGWSPDTNNFTTFSATDTNTTTTKIQYLGRLGDIGCNQTTVVLQTPPPSNKYRFTVFFTSTNSIPATTNYPLVLHNFQP